MSQKTANSATLLKTNAYYIKDGHAKIMMLVVVRGPTWALWPPKRPPPCHRSNVPQRMLEILCPWICLFFRDFSLCTMVNHHPCRRNSAHAVRRVTLGAGDKARGPTSTASDASKRKNLYAKLVKIPKKDFFQQHYEAVQPWWPQGQGQSEMYCMVPDLLFCSSGRKDKVSTLVIQGSRSCFPFDALSVLLGAQISRTRLLLVSPASGSTSVGR